MKRNIVITEEQLKQYVKSQINEKHDDLVRGVVKNDNGEITHYMVKPNAEEYEIVPRFDSDRRKRAERKERKQKPEPRDMEKAKKAAKASKERTNQLLLPFGEEEKCANKFKEKRFKK